jgi:hypothetical protein
VVQTANIADMSENVESLNRPLGDMTSAENRATFFPCVRLAPEDIDASSSLRILSPWFIPNIRPFPYLSTLCRNSPSLQNSPLGIRPIEKYNTKHIQPKPFSPTLLSAGTLPELEGQLLSVLDARRAPSMSLKSAQATTQLHSLVQDISKERLVSFVNWKP